MSSLLNLFWKKKSTVPTSTKITAEILTSERNDTSGSKGDDVSSSTLDSLSSEVSMKTDYLRGSASSVFNMPEKQSSIMQNLFVMFEEHVVENIGGIALLPERKNFRPDVSPEDFQVYVDNLKGSYHMYVKEKELSTQESFEKERTNLTENLLLCYNTIPQKYFEHDFHLNVAVFEQEPEKLADIQNILESDLEKVKANLYSQISSKFDFIIETIHTLTLQEQKIDKSLRAIKALKESNKKLKETNTSQIIDILKLKKKQLNLQKTKQILETVGVFKKIVPTLTHLVQKGNFESAVNLLLSSEQMVNQKLNNIACLKIYCNKLQEAKTLLQQSLINEFEAIALEHLLKPLSDNSKNAHLPEEIAKHILSHIKLKEISFITLRPKLHEALKHFHTQFLAKTKESSNCQNKQLELLLSYVESYKQFFIRFSNIHNMSVSQVISYFKNIPDITLQNTKVLSATLQEFYSIYALIIRNFNDKITQLLQLINISALSREQFSTFSDILGEIIVYFQENFDSQQKFHSEWKSENDLLNKTLLKTTSSLLEQLSVTSLNTLRLFYEKQYFQAYSNLEKENLTYKIKNETWKPIEVPSESLESLKLFHESEQKEFTENSFSVKKKTILINSKTYKASASYLALVRAISEITLFAEKFTTLREECLSKIVILINTFISNVQYDILEGHSKSSALGGVITPDILAFAAATLSLLKNGLNTLHSKSYLQNSSSQLLNKTSNTLISNLLTKISDMLRDLVLIEKCNQLKALSWNDDTQSDFQAPTKHSNEILEKVKAVYKNISKYLPREFSFAVLNQIFDNLTDLYLPIFIELEIDNALIAERVKNELQTFSSTIMGIESHIDADFHPFENKVADIINDKCNIFFK